MPKMIIEINLPEGQAIPSAEDCARLTSPDWHCDWWHIEDVQAIDERLTDDEARDVLSIMAKKSDASIGINWDSIATWVDWVKDARVKA